MKINEIVNTLKKNNYRRKTFVKQIIYEGTGESSNFDSIKILDFPIVFVDTEEKEVYILEEKTNEVFTDDEIRKMEKKVASFIYTRPNNDSIKYNINLILICPIYEEDGKSQVVALERDKYFCRKIFVNSGLEGESFNDEINILPFIPISKISEGYELSSMINVVEQVKKIIPDNLWEKLISEEEPTLDQLENDLSALCEGE